jgi:Uma2 family endonuclease
MNEQAPAPRPATYQDVLDAPPNMVAELVAGRLHLQPRPAARRARASFKLGARLDDPFDNGVGGPGGWYFAIEPELHLGEDVLVPDLAGWRRARMETFPDTAAIELAPDWVCELLSPGTRRFDLTEKRDLYGANGVGHLWLADPGGHARGLRAAGRRLGAAGGAQGRRRGAAAALRGDRLSALGALARLSGGGRPTVGRGFFHCFC